MFSKFFKHQPVAANTEEKVHLNVQSDLESSENNMVLRTEDLVKKYRQRTVVNHVSIDVTQGKSWVVGPEWRRKDNDFLYDDRIDNPQSGHIYLNDLDITDYPVYKRAQIGIGYLAQEASVFRKLSVEDNIRCVLEMTHTTKEYQRDKLESLIAEFRLQKVRKNLETNYREVKGVEPKLHAVWLLVLNLLCSMSLLQESILLLWKISSLLYIS